jgi:hypothetical protein
LSLPTYNTLPSCTSIDWYNPSSPFFEVKIFAFENNLALVIVMLIGYKRSMQCVESGHIYGIADLISRKAYDGQSRVDERMQPPLARVFGYHGD